MVLYFSSMKAQPIPGRYFNRQPEVSERMSWEQFQILHICTSHIRKKAPHIKVCVILSQNNSNIYRGASQALRLINCCFPTLSSHFLPLPTTWISFTKLKFSLHLSWFKSYDTKWKYFLFYFFPFCRKKSYLRIVFPVFRFFVFFAFLRFFFCISVITFELITI